MGCGDRSVTFIKEYRITIPWGTWKLLAISQNPNPNNTEIEMLINCDFVTTSANSSQGESQLYIFEDNEAVMKMIIKGRRPELRHVSRTHRVALDWLFDRIKLDTKIQIKCVDTKNHVADMLTNGSFTRDEWDHLLRWLHIMNFSMFSRSHFLLKRKQSCPRELRKTRLNKG